MGGLLLAPALLPLATAAAVTLCRGRASQRAVTVLGLALWAACALWLCRRVATHGSMRLVLGGWPAPFGIELVADPLAASMIMVTAVVGIATISFQCCSVDAAAWRPTLLPLMLALLGGAAGAFVAGDLFNLYVWFEILLMSALGLLALEGRSRNLDATLKYFVLNALGTLLFLIGIAYLYAATGHLNYAELREAGRQPGAATWLPLMTPLALAFLIKAGGFPVFAWLPASYHTLPAPVLALFAGLLTKVGVYALLRLFGDLFPLAPPSMFEVLGWLTVATMLSGALGAAYHWDLRRILAFHIISQIGYLLLGIALGTAAGEVATIFFLIHNIVAKTNLILIAAIVFKLTSSYDLRRCGGLYAKRPGLAAIFLISALAMVGIPPLSGFWAKLLLVREAFEVSRTTWAIGALMTGFLTLYSMTKIGFEAFWKPHPSSGWRPPSSPRLRGAYAVVIALAGSSVAMGLAPEPIIRFLRASEQPTASALAPQTAAVVAKASPEAPR